MTSHDYIPGSEDYFPGKAKMKSRTSDALVFAVGEANELKNLRR